jgi:hypothetical protein
MVKFVTDLLVEEAPGGAERVDDTVIKHFNLDVIKSVDFNPVKGEFYILSNVSLVPQSKLEYLTDNCNYVILEHDYKFHHTRHPWRFENSIVPSNEIINRKLYKNAKSIFVQTKDHLDVFKLNDIEGNFVNLDCSVWSTKELETLRELYYLSRLKESSFAIINSQNWIKNTKQSVDFCKSMKMDYTLIANQDYDSFLRALSKHAALVFFPIARETCCRLLVEARCLGLNVITSENSGAFKSEWFTLSGLELIDYLKNKSIGNLSIIKETLGL